VVSAPAGAQHQLLELQSVDTGLAQVEYKKQNLADAVRLRELSNTLAERQADLARARTQEHDLSLEAAKADADVELVRSRRDRDQKRLDAGQGSAKDLSNLLHEVETLGRRQSELEDVELEIMERLESARDVVESLARRVEELTVQRVELRTRVDDQMADLDSEVARLASSRAAMLPKLPSDLLALYERIRTSMNGGGVGAAALRQGRCEGCRMPLAPTELARISSLGPDAVVQCDECRRILVRVG
jgi:predicted  nucleic acid-binding Zn-ribbon protein